ncbi:MAG: leucine-rich repeat protein [Clostridia bacterium]|nr:leucine-rich repeat protein [Clostridia bacterium]
MKTRILSAFTALVMFITMLLTPQLITGASAADGVSLPFKDVRSNQWFYGAVQKMYTSGLMEGKSKDKFDPKATMTRAELVTLMARLAGEEVDGLGRFAEHFSDVGKKAWYKDYVGWASKNGLAQGYGGGLFKPNAPIKRLELATFIIRLIDYVELDLPEAPLIERFNDTVTFPSWAKDNIEQMRKLGLIEGNEKSNFLAYASVTRAEVATIVSRFCDQLTVDPMHEALRRIPSVIENRNGRAVIRLGDASTVTPENISLILINSATELDTSVYSVVCDNNAVASIRNGAYKDVEVGGYYDTQLKIYIKNKITGEVTDPYNLEVKIIRVADLEAEMIPEFKYKIKTDGTCEIVDYIGVRYVKNLKIPSSIGGHRVTSIGKAAFKESRELESVVIPDSVTFIDTEAFSLCRNLEKVSIPSSVTKIGRAAFYYCSSLESVRLPRNLARIPDYMFYMCTSLEEIITYDTLEEVGKYSFSNCSLVDFNFNEGLEIVGEYAFEGCLFTSVRLPDSCTYAGHWAFYNCLLLSEASFGDRLELIGSGILYNTAVKELHFRGTSETFDNIYMLSAFDKEFPIIFEK